jgi:hypothetical protein
MAGGVCFGSCLSSIGGFFTNPKNHFSTKINSTPFLDKTLKFGDPFIEAIGELAKLGGASDRTYEAIGKVRQIDKGCRDGMAFFNIFNGVIAAMVNHMKNFFMLIGALRTGDKVRFKEKNTKQPDKNKHTDKIPEDTAGKTHTTERLLAAGANLGKGTASAAYIFGFGICRPIENLNKYVRDKNGSPLIPMSEGTLKLGHAFSTVMVVNHVGGFFGNGCEIGYQCFAHSRLVEEGKCTAKVEQDFKDAIVKSVLSLFEKFLELIMDVVALIGTAAPAWFRLPVLMGIGALGMTKEWISVE